MKYLRTFTIGVVMAMIQAAAWAQIYESRDAQGNPVFSDEPIDGDASVVDLTDTNIADAPARAPAEETPNTETEKETAVTNNDRPAFEDPNEELWQDRIQRREEFEKTRASEEPHGVLDAEPRHKVRDADTRHEVRDADTRREVLDADPRKEVMDAEPRREVMDAEPRHKTR